MLHELDYVDIAVHDGVMTIHITGDIDHHSAKPIREKMDRELFRVRPRRVELDLSKVDFMDSSGLGLIMGRSNTASELGAEFVLVNPCHSVSKILSLAGVGRLMKIIVRS